MHTDVIRVIKYIVTVVSAIVAFLNLSMLIFRKKESGAIKFSTWRLPTLALRKGNLLRERKFIYSICTFLLNSIAMGLIYNVLVPIIKDFFFYSPWQFESLLLSIGIFVDIAIIMIFMLDKGLYGYKFNFKHSITICMMACLCILTIGVGVYAQCSVFVESAFMLNILVNLIIVLCISIRILIGKGLVIKYKFKKNEDITCRIEFNEGGVWQLDVLKENVYIVEDNYVLIRSKSKHKAYSPDLIKSIHIGEAKAVYNGEKWISATIRESK